MLASWCDCKAAVMEAGGGGGVRERERGRQVRCQTAAVTAGQGLQAVTHAGTPCRNRTVGEGLPVREPMGEERCVWMGGGLFCTNQTFSASQSQSRDVTMRTPGLFLLAALQYVKY